MRLTALTLVLRRLRKVDLIFQKELGFVFIIYISQIPRLFRTIKACDMLLLWVGEGKELGRIGTACLCV